MYIFLASTSLCWRVKPSQQRKYQRRLGWVKSCVVVANDKTELTYIKLAYIGHLLQLKSITAAVHRRMKIVFYEYDGQMISGNECGSPDICFVVRKALEKLKKKC